MALIQLACNSEKQPVDNNWNQLLKQTHLKSSEKHFFPFFKQATFNARITIKKILIALEVPFRHIHVFVQCLYCTVLRLSSMV